MPGVARKADICSGHDLCPPRANTSWSPDVFVNGRNVHRQGDAWAVHGCVDHAPHPSVLSSGSSTVIVNNKQCGRCGDPVACGSSVATCSSDVIAGG